MLGAVPSVAPPPEASDGVPSGVILRPHPRIWAHHWAREIIRRHGTGTLDYFALRDDKQHFFVGESLVAYRVFSGVCLVAPDPIGPQAERSHVWASFRRFAAERDWTVAVLGAAPAWLPLYAEGNMRALYIGDEAVVDASDFQLAGGRRKGLRQAYNRIERNGYSASFHDPTDIDSDLAISVLKVMERGRIGEEERGFSMTLGRIFDEADDGLLLALASDRDGVPVAFCQFVPAPAINGYSLDLMRWDHGEHANGLIDFLMVSTLQELRRRELRGLGLNFAAMRAVVTGETGTSFVQSVARLGLHWLSDSVQIESLCRFDAKYGPDWQARYIAYDRLRDLPKALFAIMRAESLVEMPLVGRFARPDAVGASPERSRRT